MPDSCHVVFIRPEFLLDTVRVRGDRDEIHEQGPIFSAGGHPGGRVPAEAVWGFRAPSNSGGNVHSLVRGGYSVLASRPAAVTNAGMEWPISQRKRRGGLWTRRGF